MWQTANKTPESQGNSIKKHIESFPTVEAHYVRQNSQRKYLGSDLSVPTMHKLYTEYCVEKGIPAASLKVYRKIFTDKYNLSFHKPKKNVCSKCHIYGERKKRNELTDEMEQAHTAHQNRKEQS